MAAKARNQISPVQQFQLELDSGNLQAAFGKTGCDWNNSRRHEVEGGQSWTGEWNSQIGQRTAYLEENKQKGMARERGSHVGGG